MKSRIKKLWLEALRSGEYLQGTKCLRSGDKYCCLGVLTDLYIKEHPEQQWCKVWADDFTYFIKGESGVLTQEIMEWAGLSATNPCIEEDAPLASLNDRGCSFSVIADKIERGIPEDAEE